MEYDREKYLKFKDGRQTETGTLHIARFSCSDVTQTSVGSF